MAGAERPTCRARRWRLLGMVLAGSLWATTALGQPAWRDLSPQERATLQPLAGQWDRMSAGDRDKWRAMARELQHRPPEDRARAQARMSEWARMPPQQRDAARRQFESAGNLSPQERQQRWRAYQELSPQEKRALGAREQRNAPAASPRGPGDGPSSARDRRKDGPPRRDR